ncbi:hypothetical protein [Herpetosiphon sp. NSE202]|uniref:hypothetical protein n=1 Tax=Herpetosiphon sp. NSE202 TaxID=3351349 RepID=UPI00363E8E74
MAGVNEYELLTQNIYAELTTRFAEDDPHVSVSLQGKGVNWSCTIQAAKRACKISVYPREAMPYWIGFQNADTSVADGWTAHASDLYLPIAAWLHGADRAELYTRGEFIDREIRALGDLEAKLIEHDHALSAMLRHELQPFSKRAYDLVAQNPTRSCRIKFYGHNELPDAHFLWDDCPLFQFPVTQSADLAVMLRRWLIDSAAPSALEQEFPWLSVGKLAHYYEGGQGIEGEFIVSWDRMAVFYTNFNWPMAPIGHRFVGILRDAGYDRLFRAGQSLVTLVLSRSRRHNLRMEQASISFLFYADATMNVTLNKIGGRKEHVFYRLPVALTPNLRQMLDQFARQAID